MTKMRHAKRAVTMRQRFGSLHSVLCLLFLLSFTLPWLHLANDQSHLNLSGFEYLGAAFVDHGQADLVLLYRPSDDNASGFPLLVKPIDRMQYLTPAFVWLLAFVGLWFKRRLLLVLGIFLMMLHLDLFWAADNVLQRNLWWVYFISIFHLVVLNEIRGQFWRAKTCGDRLATYTPIVVFLLGLGLIRNVVDRALNGWTMGPDLFNDQIPFMLMVGFALYGMWFSFRWPFNKKSRLGNSGVVWTAHGGMLAMMLVMNVDYLKFTVMASTRTNLQLGAVLFCLILGIMMLQVSLDEAKTRQETAGDHVMGGKG